MKAFEEWSGGGEYMEDFEYAGAYAGWKAALEWIQKMMIENKMTNGQSYNIEDEIRQELKD